VVTNVVSAYKRIYTVSEKNFLLHTGMWVGSILNDHGKIMKIAAIGQVYRVGKERLIDLETEEVEHDQWLVELEKRRKTPE